jgi:hypothetical protein
MANPHPESPEVYWKRRALASDARAEKAERTLVRLAERPQEAIVFSKVSDERRRQDAMGHAADYPDGTGTDAATSSLAQARADYEFAEQVGCLTWLHVLREEVLEVFAEKDSTKLLPELYQVAAVAIRWATAILSRPAARTDTPTVRDDSASARRLAKLLSEEFVAANWGRFDIDLLARVASGLDAAVATEYPDAEMEENLLDMESVLARVASRLRSDPAGTL